MEAAMLLTLDFNINFVSSNSFLERFVQMAKVNKITADLAQYMIEIALLDYDSILVRPSVMAMGALYLA